MATRLTYNQKREQAVVDLIDEMFKIAGHSVTYADVVSRKDDWYNDWTITEEQYDQWIQWGIKYLIKKLKLTSKGAEKEMGMVGLMWGLRFNTRVTK